MLKRKKSIDDPDKGEILKSKPAKNLIGGVKRMQPESSDTEKEGNSGYSLRKRTRSNDNPNTGKTNKKASSPELVAQETNPDKTCQHCGEEFNKTIGLHLRGNKECKAKYEEWGISTKLSRSEINKNAREKNKARDKEYQKGYRDTHKEESKEYQKDYRDTHKEESKEYQKGYRETHKAQSKEWKDNNRCEEKKKRKTRNANKKLLTTPADRIKRFKESNKEGWSFPCTSCYRIFFKEQVYLLKEDVEEKLKNLMVVESLRYKFICRNCHSYVKKDKLPPQNIKNGLQLDSQPDCLKKLSDLESVLIARKILFIKIFQLPLGMDATVDKVVHVPGLATTTNFCNTFSCTESVLKLLSDIDAFYNS